MRTAVDDALREEATRFRLRFTCEYCAYFDGKSRTCSEGYPNAAHRDVQLPRVTSLEFCKSFELG
jgi:hypothetical protein